VALDGRTASGQMRFITCCGACLTSITDPDDRHTYHPLLVVDGDTASPSPSCSGRGPSTPALIDRVSEGMGSHCPNIARSPEGGAPRRLTCRAG